tara:strand:+ start:18818 stop:19351 length:534 start_codon:yes stop_codon:yes gene_type:complete
MKAFLVFLSLFSVKAFAIETVEYVDLSRYVGTWYQVANKPQWFEPDVCVCARQSLTPLESGLVGVYNSCNEDGPKGKINDIQGTAENDDPQTNSKFVVDFGLPFKGSYWIIGLDEEYRWAVVSDKRGRSLYILSKTPYLAEDLYQAALEAASQQVSLEGLEETYHGEDCAYPQVPRQ